MDSPDVAPRIAGAARNRRVPAADSTRVMTGTALANRGDPILTPNLAPRLIPASHRAMTSPHAISDPPMAAIDSRSRIDWAITVAAPKRSVVVVAVGIVVFTASIVSDDTHVMSRLSSFQILAAGLRQTVGKNLRSGTENPGHDARGWF